MRREPLIMACCSDIAGQVRGKAFPLRDLERRLCDRRRLVPDQPADHRVQQHRRDALSARSAMRC